MFKSKYIFETQKTKLFRYLKSILIIFIILFLCYLTLGWVVIAVAEKESKFANDQFFKKSPDLIAIFTGDTGRIPLGIKKAKEYKQSNIFITGVYSKNTVNTLITPLEITKQFDPDLLEIDYHARNTIENGISTLRYLRKHSGMNKILIVSHDYHLLRIKLIMSKIQSSTDGFKFYYTGVTTDYNNAQNIKKLYKEVYKLIRTYFFLMLWGVSD